MSVPPVPVARGSAPEPLELAARAAGTQLGREIMRGVMGTLFGGRRR